MIMNRDGIYKFPDDAPSQYLLFFNEDDKWEMTHKKVKPSIDMVIIYED